MATMKCTSYCMPAVKAPYKQYFKPCVRPDWSKKPGFWDPCVVTENCFSVLARSIYSTTKTMHAERPTIDEPCGKHLQERNICRGIKMYLEPWQEQEGIEEAVQRYIYCPCKAELIDAIDMKPERALAFLLTYFKNRGPFLTWIHRGREFANAAGRCLSTAFVSRLNTLPEIDLCAAVAIGRYLSNLFRIAADHKIVNFRTNLATVWGPIYINVEPATDVQPPVIMTECEKFKASVEIFAKVLDKVPWEAAVPLKKVSLSAMTVPYMDSVYTTTNRLREACLMKLINKPSSCKGSLEEILRNQAMIVCTNAEKQKPKEEIEMPKCCTELVSLDKLQRSCDRPC